MSVAIVGHWFGSKTMPLPVMGITRYIVGGTRVINVMKG